jgi:hypothetical protein
VISVVVIPLNNLLMMATTRAGGNRLAIAVLLITAAVLTGFMNYIVGFWIPPAATSTQALLTHDALPHPTARPPLDQRTFTSATIDAFIEHFTAKLKDKDLATLFTNCFPNTLGTLL